MNNAEWIEMIGAITDPIEMLKAILENADFLGYDPYYADHRATLLDQARKIVEEVDCDAND